MKKLKWVLPLFAFILLCFSASSHQVYADGYTVYYYNYYSPDHPDPQTKSPGASIQLSNKIPTWTGHTFLYWSTNSSGTGTLYSPGSTYSKDANLYLYAIFDGITTTTTTRATTTTTTTRATTTTTTTKATTTNTTTKATTTTTTTTTTTEAPTTTTTEPSTEITTTTITEPSTETTTTTTRTEMPATNDLPGTKTTEAPDEASQEQAILAKRDDKDLKGSSFLPLLAKQKKAAKTSISLTWSKVSGASYYAVYGGRSGKAFDLLGLVKKNTFTQKKLKKGTGYKYIIVANGGGKALATSKIIFISTTGGKTGNPTGVTVKKTSVTLKKGKTFKMGAAVKKKGSVKNYRKLSYETSNASVAKVNSSGKVTAVGKGTCYVYAYTQNGMYKRVKVRVK